MKDNVGYRKSPTTIELGPQMYDDCTPMTRRGTASMVDRFYALRVLGLEEGGGGAPYTPGSTSSTLR